MSEKIELEDMDPALFTADFIRELDSLDKIKAKKLYHEYLLNSRNIDKAVGARQTYEEYRSKKKALKICVNSGCFNDAEEGYYTCMKHKEEARLAGRKKMERLRNKK